MPALVAAVACLLPTVSACIQQPASTREPAPTTSEPAGSASEERLQLALERMQELAQECVRQGREVAGAREEVARLEVERTALKEQVETLEKQLAELARSQHEALAVAKAAQEQVRGLMAARSSPPNEAPRAAPRVAAGGSVEGGDRLSPANDAEPTSTTNRADPFATPPGNKQ
jgi:septal ring factor EnvC (AmiA/AmiB activator)